jgi:hypothetical protein
MTVRTWGRVVLTAVGAGAMVGAGQLGVAYGLGIVDLSRSFGADSGNQWNAQLAWVCWFALLAAVGGAATAERVARRNKFTPGIGTRILVALFGGIGAGAVIPLSVQPARAADLTQAVDPALVVGLTAGLGVVAGVLVAVVALSVRPLAWDLGIVATVIWLATLAEVAPHLGLDDTRSIRLGVPQWTVREGETGRLVEMLAMPVLALLAGLLVAAVARSRRESGLATAVSGTAGAATLALAYLIAGPGGNGDTADQMAPYLGALIAIPAGLLGSLLITAIRRTGPARDTAKASARTRPADPVEPTNILPPLVKEGQRGPTVASAPVPPQRARGSAAAPRWDEHVDWVGGLGEAPTGSLPRRVPGERFPAGA